MRSLTSTMDRQCRTELLRSCEAATPLIEASSKRARKSLTKKDRIRAAVPDRVKQPLVVSYLTFGSSDIRPIQAGDKKRPDRYRPGRHANSTLTPKLSRYWTRTRPSQPQLVNFSARLLRRRSGSPELLLDLALQLLCPRRQRIGAGLQEIGVKAAIVVDALERIGRDAQAHIASERIRDESDVAQVRQEAPLGLDVRVAHLVAHLRGLGRQFTAPRHDRKILFHPRP